MKGSIRSKGHAEKVLAEQKKELERLENRQAKTKVKLDEIKSNVNYLKSFIGSAKKSKEDQE